MYVTVNGNGVIMDPVFIQDENLKEDDCFIHPVIGLGATASKSSKGYIVFMKSRSGIVEFYRWVTGTLIPETVDQIDEAFPELHISVEFLTAIHPLESQAGFEAFQHVPVEL